MEIEGTLEVIHSDDFEHPENSKYFFYLISGNKRYELSSNKELPVVLSGTLAKVKGKILGDSIIVENFELIKYANATSQLAEDVKSFLKNEKQIQQQSTKNVTTESKINLNWIYIGLPILLAFGFLFYFELERKKYHRELFRQNKQQNVLALRNYILTNSRRGYNKEEIRNALIKNNYNNEEIEEAFRGLK